MWEMASSWTNNNSRRRHGFFRGGDSLPFLVCEKSLIEMLRKFGEKRVPWERRPAGTLFEIGAGGFVSVSAEENDVVLSRYQRSRYDQKHCYDPEFHPHPPRAKTTI
jgi:hypothetical protein